MKIIVYCCTLIMLLSSCGNLSNKDIPDAIGIQNALPQVIITNDRGTRVEHAPIENPGGMQFDADQEFVKSYNLYNKRINKGSEAGHDVIKEGIIKENIDEFSMYKLMGAKTITNFNCMNESRKYDLIDNTGSNINQNNSKSVSSSKKNWQEDLTKESIDKPISELSDGGSGSLFSNAKKSKDKQLVDDGHVTTKMPMDQIDNNELTMSSEKYDTPDYGIPKQSIFSSFSKKKKTCSKKRGLATLTPQIEEVKDYSVEDGLFEDQQLALMDVVESKSLLSAQDKEVTAPKVKPEA